MKYVVTLIGGIGNIIQTAPLMSCLRSQGHTVFARRHQHAYSEEACRLVSPSYDELISHGETVEGAVDRGSMLARAEGKRLVLSNPEWAAWFLFHGMDVPDDLSMEVLPGPDPQVECRVVVAPTSKPNWPMKKYPHWDAVIGAFPGCAVVGLEGDGGELEGDFVDLRGRLSLMEVAGLVRTAGVTICEEGGIGHLSAAEGTPTVILFGGTSVVKNLPPANGYAVGPQVEFPCRPCQGRDMHTSGSGIGRAYHGCRPHEMVEGHTRCMAAISPESVTEEARRWLFTRH
jgi:hypothetical protein